MRKYKYNKIDNRIDCYMIEEESDSRILYIDHFDDNKVKIHMKNFPNASKWYETESECREATIQEIEYENTVLQNIIFRNNHIVENI